MSSVACPSCGKSFAPPPGSAGKTAKCSCGTGFTIAASSAAPEPLPLHGAKRPAPTAQRPGNGIDAREFANFLAFAKWFLAAGALAAGAYPFLVGELKLHAHIWIELGVLLGVVALFVQAEESRLRRRAAPAGTPERRGRARPPERPRK